MQCRDMFKLQVSYDDLGSGARYQTVYVTAKSLAYVCVCKALIELLFTPEARLPGSLSLSEIFTGSENTSDKRT